MGQDHRRWIIDPDHPKIAKSFENRRNWSTVAGLVIAGDLQIQGQLV
jgi:hypothetical protein